MSCTNLQYFVLGCGSFPQAWLEPVVSRLMLFLQESPHPLTCIAGILSYIYFCSNYVYHISPHTLSF